MSLTVYSSEVYEQRARCRHPVQPFTPSGCMSSAKSRHRTVSFVLSARQKPVPEHTGVCPQCFPSGCGHTLFRGQRKRGPRHHRARCHSRVRDVRPRHGSITSRLRKMRPAGLVYSTSFVQHTYLFTQFQVPQDSSIKSVEDLAGKRVSTSFEVLAGKYFRELDTKLGLIEDEKRTKIAYVGGSVEAACALGLADGIGLSQASCCAALDSDTSPSGPCRCAITSPGGSSVQRAEAAPTAESGETMRAAGLHAIGTLLQTEAVMIKSSAPKHAHLAPLIEKITKRIAGVVASSKYVLPILETQI